MASITTPVTVVAQPYNTSGNGGRKLVRLSNGWLVAAVHKGSASPFTNIFYKSEDNGVTWTRLCSLSTVLQAGNTVAMVSKGTRVFVLQKDGSAQLGFATFDALTQTDVAITTTVLDSGQTDLGPTPTLAINNAGTELHAAWASKNSTYPNSFNIRYAKGTIDGNGNVTWGSVEQVTKYNTSGSDIINPCIIFSTEPIIFTNTTGSVSAAGWITCFKKSLSSYNVYSSGYSNWGNVGVNSGASSSYPPSSPCAVVDGNGVIHVVWHGKDATDTSRDNVRYSKSTDGGVTWSAATKLTSGNTYDQRNASITVDKDNKIFVVWQGKSSANPNYFEIRVVSYDGASWGTITDLTSGAIGNHRQYPSALLDKTVQITSPPIIYQDTQDSKVKFLGTWTTNQNPSITLTSPGDNQTLAEGNTMPVAGEASDADNGNVVTVKYKINNGTARAIASGVSDGSSPLSFAKSLTYSNKRLWDGSTDVTGADLAENVDHVLTVWAEDDQGGKSAEITRKFRVSHNKPPAITVDAFTPVQSGLIPPDLITISGTVSDPDGNTVTVTGKANNGAPQTLLSGVSGGNWSFSFPVSALQEGGNTITITATDQFGSSTVKTFNVNNAITKTPLDKGVARYKVTPPLGAAKEILAWMQREIGDLSVDGAASFVDAGQSEQYMTMAKSSVDLAHGIAEDEFVASVADPKADIVFKQTFTRTNTDSSESALKLVGVIE
ncbi:Ig-like domain-containing protein [Brevibacillus agri]|uniref:Ig-like domain-containing protein n=1 Tax=Brevibacillus agri TaxID=51101 RepID=UPI003D2126B9